MLKRELGPIRPPSEHSSLLIRLTRGCHWNRCSFCGLYKNMKFSIRSVEDILQDIKETALYYGERVNFFHSCFLQDGDALNIPTKDLLVVLRFINRKFPSLNHITTYARCDTILKKTENELKELCDEKLNHLYRGIESGSNSILKNINKGISSTDIIQSGLMCKKAGMTLSEFTLLGIGGKFLSVENAVETAKVINAVNPEYIRVHHTAFKPNTKLGRDVEKGLFEL
ncbi:radical SAM protein [Treponema pedis]|nr:radical SAM protein [Treponema pedis]